MSMSFDGRFGEMRFAAEGRRHVYKAFDTSLNRIVCVKLKRPLQTYSWGIDDRLLREVAILKRADHTSIVKLLDVFVPDYPSRSRRLVLMIALLMVQRF